MIELSVSIILCQNVTRFWELSGSTMFYVRVGSNVMDVRYKVVALTYDATICRPFKNNFVFELHLKLFRPF